MPSQFPHELTNSAETVQFVPGVVDGAVSDGAVLEVGVLDDEEFDDEENEGFPPPEGGAGVECGPTIPFSADWESTAWW